MKRKRKKQGAICSSTNYRQSRQQYYDYLRRWHNEHVEEVERLSASIQVTTSIRVVHKKAHVRVFGELIPITIEEAEILKETTLIIYQ